MSFSNNSHTPWSTDAITFQQATGTACRFVRGFLNPRHILVCIFQFPRHWQLCRALKGCPISRRNYTFVCLISVINIVTADSLPKKQKIVVSIIKNSTSKSKKLQIRRYSSNSPRQRRIFPLERNASFIFSVFLKTCKLSPKLINSTEMT